jgi:hypothetical protein
VILNGAYRWFNGRQAGLGGVAQADPDLPFLIAAARWSGQ